MTKITTTNVGNGPIGAIVDPEGNYVYVSNFGSGTISVLDIVTDETIATIELETSNPRRLAIDSNYLWVGNFDSNSITQINRDTLSVVKTIEVGTGDSYPRGIASDGTYVWVSCSGNNTVEKIDIATSTILNTTLVNGTPYGLTVCVLYVWACALVCMCA